MGITLRLAHSREVREKSSSPQRAAVSSGETSASAPESSRWPAWLTVGPSRICRRAFAAVAHKSSAGGSPVERRATRPQQAARASPSPGTASGSSAAVARKPSAEGSREKRRVKLSMGASEVVAPFPKRAKYGTAEGQDTSYPFAHRSSLGAPWSTPLLRVSFAVLSYFSVCRFLWTAFGTWQDEATVVCRILVRRGQRVQICIVITTLTNKRRSAMVCATFTSKRKITSMTAGIIPYGLMGLEGSGEPAYPPGPLSSVPDPRVEPEEPVGGSVSDRVALPSRRLVRDGASHPNHYEGGREGVSHPARGGDAHDGASSLSAL